MKHTRKTAGYTWTDRKTNIEIAKELNGTQVLEKSIGLHNKVFAVYKRNVL
jgi:hypothetical protein